MDQSERENARDGRFRKRRDVPSGLWTRCSACSKMIYKSLVLERGNVCPECNYHFEITSDERIALICDPESFEERFTDLAPGDPLEFVAKRSYSERLAEVQAKTGLKDGAVVGTASIARHPVVFGVSDSRFLRGSMGSVVGEKICRGMELARELGHPFIFVSGSGGGARMDEGMFSLMQMAKTSAAVARLHESGGMFISILTNPTMGGAMASFAALGDIVMAEPKALIGFAGPNVIRQTIKAELPDGFQSSEFNLKHGFIDRVVDRKDLRGTLIRILNYVCPAEV
ncbi:MAG: acetyl-CoA carboxylase carboxyltransferase subunit beta [Planctomycetes bacterium]|nr:acetyl-CoA carboxylase carboxyltransferase subunit beta [Planctomycetota bacterium]